MIDMTTFYIAPSKSQMRQIGSIFVNSIFIYILICTANDELLDEKVKPLSIFSE
jgi:hypothetical protein